MPIPLINISMDFNQKDNNLDEVNGGQNIDPKKRFENVATALYLVTNHLPEHEPLKIKIRETAHIVLEEFINLSDISIKLIGGRLDHILTLVKIASVAGLVSHQNAALLIKEIDQVQTGLLAEKRTYQKMSLNIEHVLGLGLEHKEVESIHIPTFVDYIHSLDSQIDSTRSRGLLASEYQLPEIDLFNNPTDSQMGRNSYPAHFNGNTNIQHSKVSSASHTGSYIDSNNNVFKAHINKGANNRSSSQTPKSNQTKNQDRNSQLSMGGANGLNAGSVYDQSRNSVNQKKEGYSERQNIILREIKNRGQLTIRDLVGKIEGCSEKTIQRELLALVEGGVLKKEGERRWSKYSISQA